ncbi:amyloid beta A4 precursor protein-binding family B member 2-like protein [Dinothrombium tinctorium]|uniref:Amyloid beta A4 protein-binding family B member 2-like protein n=1 Tax=Dinothrombium tinctorium TaxID=1965070 RepID=A0A443RB82_9ACAR|nr:amyloid beta A4 precursor protein-binding family B member 2-like protein [Dinothrombium tinctorium]
MESPSPGSESDSNRTFDNFENPNFRKLYATLSVTTMMGSADESLKHANGDGDEYGEEKKDSNELPDGWEKHEDDNGPYYWHIPSGTIQREKPSFSSAKRDSIIYYEEENEESVEQPRQMNDSTMDAKTFLVHSLGWTEFDEKQLTPALSSKAIQKCILELSTRGENAVRCWGKHDTKQLIVKIENSNLKLYDNATNKLLNLQPISGIRVWGVNDNNDFAYVARDPPPPMINMLRDDDDCCETGAPAISPTLSPTTPPILKCHVFHCDAESNQEAAHKIATILRDEVIRLKSQQESKRIDGNQPTLQRPQNLYIDESNTSPLSSPTIEFPTPIEEPRKTIVAKYLGKIKVLKPVGVNVLNEAITKVIGAVSACEQNPSQSPLLNQTVVNVVCLVHISPSTITVESTINGDILLESRVRYLSFLGIHRENVKNCGFIIQVDENAFEAHCFECEPNAGALCKTIEAACKLRYQKCLDAHKQRCNSALLAATESRTISATNQTANIKTTIKNVFSKLLTK